MIICVYDPPSRLEGNIREIDWKQFSNRRCLSSVLECQYENAFIAELGLSGIDHFPVGRVCSVERYVDAGGNDNGCKFAQPRSAKIPDKKKPNLSSVDQPIGLQQLVPYGKAELTKVPMHVTLSQFYFDSSFWE